MMLQLLRLCAFARKNIQGLLVLVQRSGLDGSAILLAPNVQQKKEGIRPQEWAVISYSPRVMRCISQLIISISMAAL
jgi:hypothetical protein